ncbi:MAG: hypothetical protein HY298_26275 [Verrucomicrobia bacterium]|nr:hypothetical protein [Verrucomicrobiota bacterium]
MHFTRYLIIFWLGMGAGLPLKGQAADSLHAGCLFDDFALTLSPGHRTEVMGPLFNFERQESQRQWAAPPLFSYTLDEDVDYEEFDLLYPLLTYDRFGEEYRFQIFQLFSFAGGQNVQEVSRHRFTLFPIYFQQRSADPSYNYTALLPLYGRIKNRFFRDEIYFILMPGYIQSRKRDVVTDNFLYPFFHVRHGDALHGWQFWPLVGNEHKGVTTKTNGFGDVETIGGHEKFFALWPIFSNQKSGIGTELPQKQQALLPLYSVVRSPPRDSTTLLWPFFSYIDEREKKYREWEAPWPFIVVARGEGKTTTRFWPLFSHAHSETLESDFWLWPLYKYNRQHSAPSDRERTRLLFFLFSHISEKNEETGDASRRTDFWPLFTARRDFNGNQRLQILSLLEPILPNNKSIERNYSPLWSVWRHEKNAQTGASSQSLLWNLYRRETTPETKKCSLLFGLFQYQSDTAGKRWRLF